jgi:hypothetical protein
MAEALLFRLGAGVRCADGDCGTIISLVVNPSDDTVTHLVIEPPHAQAQGRLVPLGLVETAPAGTGGEIRLRCTMVEFGELDRAESTYVFESDTYYGPSGAGSPASWPYYAPPGAMGGPGLPDQPEHIEDVAAVDIVPDQLPGEDEVAPGESVHAKDGDIGHIQGITVESGTGRVTSVLLQERHLLRHRTVEIPRQAIAEVGPDGFYLDLTTQQVRNLPAAPG